jgi:hypothetical protein
MEMRISGELPSAQIEPRWFTRRTLGYFVRRVTESDG